MSSNRIAPWLAAAGVAALAAQPATAGEDGPFRRIASFPVFLNTDVAEQTVAEIVASADGGDLLVYTDSQLEGLGFVDIADPADPQPAGFLALGGEPTSVAVKGRYALVCTDTSVDFVNTSGELAVVDVFTRQIVRTLPLGGQPDAIAISPSGRFGAVCIENERDEDLGNGAPPQLPAGFLVIVDLNGPVANWSTRVVDLTGVCDLYPEDPEPEFVDISRANVAAVTCQENNHVVLVHLPTGNVVADFPLGAVDLDLIDTNENDLIEQQASLLGVPREPDAVVWTSNRTFATADEGDLDGGSRGFTTWGVNGAPLYQAGNTLEHLTARLGHYPESRSENKGCEPEGAEFARFGGENLLFIGSERSSVVFVYELPQPPLSGNANPILRQVLPTGVGPEGLHAIPERGLFVVACEEDERGDKYRSVISIFKYGEAPNYPTIVSADRPGLGVPIPWAALSGLVPAGTDALYAVHDSYYRASRVYGIDVSQSPAVIESELVLSDSQGVLLAALDGLKASLPGTDDFDPAAFVNADLSVNLDLEGVAVDAAGDLWIASEGAGNLIGGVSDPSNRPFVSPNLLVRATPSGAIAEVVLLPLELTRNQLRFGFEGVAVVGDFVYVAFQRAWTAAGDPSDRARIGRYDRVSGIWGFAHYPLETPTSPNGGWVGLSELSWLGGDDFAVIERDDQGGADARVKLLTRFSVSGLSFLDPTQVASFDLIAKTVVSDVLADGVYASTGGPVPEKLEGLAVFANGDAWLVNDNDGVDDNSGETQLLRLENLFN